MVHFPFALILLTSIPQQTSADSASALHRARELVRGLYETRQQHFGEEQCTGVTYDECMQGDWSCVDFICPPDLARRRAALIPVLEELARSAGQAEWLFRQRVALAVKNGEFARALAIAESCSSIEWWCLALRGFARHRLEPGRGVEHFDSAFAVMAAAADSRRNVRSPYGNATDPTCNWQDVRAVTARELISEVRRWSCPDNDDSRKRFWWLADPLWSREGNERYLEHLARHVMIRMDVDVQQLFTRQNANTEEPTWHTVNPESVYGFALRQGFPNSRRVMKSSIPGSTAYGYRGTTPYTHGGYSFTPDDIRFLRPLESTVFDWSVEALADGCSAPWTARAQAAARTSRAETWLGRGERIDTCAAERMSTRETWHNLDHQTAMFRRGDELLTVAASRIPQTFESLNQLRGSLALGRVADLSVRHARGLFDSIRNFRATITTEARDYLVSIEVIGQRDIGRARFGARLQPLIGGFGISDVALVESRFERDSLPLELALLPAARLSLSEQIGVYLEVYGIEKGEPLTIALAAEDTRASTFERIGQFFRIIPREKPVEIEWQDRHAGNMSIKRVFFSFPAAELGRGERRLRVTVRRPNGGRASAARVLTVY